MNIGEFTGLDREQQFAKAAEIASASGVQVEPSTFDGIWRTESARGANMLSPKGAKGHFGLMDDTRKTWEGRFGTTIDPMNFGQSLYTAAHTMAENLRKFKNVPDALRAYNGGWTPSKWGNKETAAYAGLVLGGDNEPATDVDASTRQATEGVGMAAVRPASTYWDQPFQRFEKPPVAAKSEISKATEAAMAIGGVPITPTMQGFATFGGAAETLASTDLAKRKTAEDTTFMQTAQAAAFRTVPVQLLMAINRDPEPIDPNYRPKEEDFKGYTEDEQKQLNAAGSQKQLDRLKFDIAYGKEQDEIVGRNGLVFGLGASFLAAAPEAFLSGGLASLALGKTAVGSVTLAQRGLKTQALVSSTAEGVLGNVINTAALDVLGDRQGVNAYALGAAGGLLNPILSGRYLGRTADKFTELAARQNIIEEATRKEAILMAQATKNLGDSAEPGLIRQEMDRLEAQGIRADIASHRNAIPESRRMNVGDEDALAEASGKTTTAEPVLGETTNPVANPQDVAAGATPVPAPADKRVATAEQPLTRDPVIEAAQAANTFKGQHPAAGRQVGMTQSPSTPTEKLFSNFADQPGQNNDTFRAQMFKRADQEPKRFAMEETTTGLVPMEGGRFAQVTVTKGGTTRVRMLDGSGEVIAAAHMQKGMIDSIAAKEKGTGAGQQLLNFLDDHKIANVDEVPDRSPGFVKGQKEVRARREAAATSDTGIEGAKADTKINERWQDPAFQANRVRQVVENPQWVKDFTTMTGGMDYKTAATLPNGVHLAPELQAAMSSSPSVRNTVQAIMDLASEYLPNSKIIVNGRVTDSGKKAGARGQIISAGDVHSIGLDVEGLRANPTGQNHTAFHELGHAIYHQHAPNAPPEILAGIANEWEAFVGKVMKGDVSARGDRLAVTHPSRFDTTPLKAGQYVLSKDEYLAEQFVQHLQNRLIAGKYGKLSTNTINQVINGVKAVLNYVKELVGLGKVKPGAASDKFFTSILEDGFKAAKAGDEFLSPDLKLPSLDDMAAASDIPAALSKEVNDLMNDPVAMRHGLDRLPMGTTAERAEAKQILALYKKAESPEYAVDEKRLSTLLNKVDALNPTSNMMLRSKNPVVRMAAIELLENGGGAAGRRSTASIAKHMNERAIIGDAIVKTKTEFDTWFKSQPGASNLTEAFTGRKRAEFDRLVAEEIEQRRYPGQQSDLGQNVRNAADTVEASFERARLMQQDAKTAGWAALPETSRGYLPHRIKSLTYRNLTLEQKRALHSELTDQFITVSDFDPTFADQLASRYLDRVEQRALGGFDAPMGMHQTGASDVIKEALEQMNLTRPEVDAMMKRHIAGAAAHTKKRLNIDLTKTITSEDGSTFRLLDLYDTDVLSLIRGQSQRVSGEVALARHGVMGKPGLAVMRRAMGYGGDLEQAVKKEIDAFDQVSAEFLGQPFGETNKWVDRAVQFNSVSSLGGMGFNQLGEQINVGATLGVKTALKIVPEFARIRAEVLTKAKGGAVDNGLLDSMEFMGGAEFGTDAYKMVFPLDNPDLFANSMGADSITGADRLLRGAGHLQSKLSLWRTVHSTQTRFVAEQIVLKAAKAMKSGSNDFHMRDMGISDEVFAALQKDIGQIATMKDGRIVKFDITKATDKQAANDFIQAVHRGGSQIIQGTFIGENGKYVHNSWLRMLTQFRSFSLTAIDKQWNRQVGNRGISGAVVVTLAAMSAAAPLYMARTYAASVGRKDQDEYLEKHLSFGSIARATTNYIATAGLAGDFLDAATAVTGTSEFTGGRSGTATTVSGNLVAPVVGKVDKLWGAVQNTKDGTDAHALIKELPLSRIPFFIPAINALDD